MVRSRNVRGDGSRNCDGVYGVDEKCAHPIEGGGDVLLVVSFQRISFLPKLICRRVLLTITPTTCDHRFVTKEADDDFIIMFKEDDWDKLGEDEVAYDVLLKSSLAKFDSLRKTNKEELDTMWPKMLEMLNNPTVSVCQNVAPCGFGKSTNVPATLCKRRKSMKAIIVEPTVVVAQANADWLRSKFGL